MCGEGPEGRHQNPRPPATCYYRTRGNAPRQPVRPDTPYCVLFIGIPTYNEATTIGVLLWRLRTVLSDVSREYEVVVYDDASTDDTADVLAPYARVLPLTLLRGTKRLGTGGAVDAIVRHVARTTRYPRRDGLLLMQADFTDSPALVPEFLRRFEGGADLIIGERASAGDAPVPVRRLFTASRWVLRPFVGISDVRDLTSSFRLARIAVLRDLLKANGDAPVASGDGWMAQADFLLRAAPHARRVETIPVTPTFGVRTRETRRTAWPDTLALAKWGWSHRGQRIAAKVIARTVDAPVEIGEPVDVPETERPERPERPERRERVSEPTDKRGRRERGGERREREERTEPRDEARTEGRERPARPPKGRRSAAPVATVAPNDEATVEVARTDDTEERADAVESERGSRKRRRGKRGAKRTGEAMEGAPVEGEPRATAPDTVADQTAPSSDDVGQDALAEGREPKRRRARRGRRRRGEGREHEAGANEERTGEDSAREGREEGEPRRREARDGSAEPVREESADVRHDEGERMHGQAGPDGDPEGGAGPRRRNRRGRRGGRRRSGSGGGGASDTPGDGDSGGAGPIDPGHG